MPTAPPKAPTKKPKKDRDKDRKEKPSPVADRLKTVIRRLPPNLPEEVFWASVAPWVTNETVTWKDFYPGKPRKRLNQENIPSRAYIAFKTEEQLALFGREYDGHLFRDKAGNESHAIVEFAPYQKVPTEKRRADARNATIEQDEDYISFLSSLNAATKAEPVSLEALIAASQPAPQPTTTPLLEALKAEKSANKDKEAILRNHAHYKEQAILAVAPRKEDTKKKATLVPKPAELGPTGKKIQNKKGAAASLPSSTQGPPPPLIIATKNNNATGQSNATPKSPKPAKVKPTPSAKVTQGAHKVVSPRATAGTASTAPPDVLSPPPPPAESGQAPASASRRRHVIGLASRHFEAALTGVGVSAPVGERKSRREREREKEARTNGAMGLNVLPTSEDAKAMPSSPERDRGVKYKKDAIRESTTPVTAQTIQVPNILQRADGPPAIVRKDSTAMNGNGPAVLRDDPSPNQARAGGGGRGGRRGRGRGRGGAQGISSREG